jgi:hypothetical protein
LGGENFRVWDVKFGGLLKQSFNYKSEQNIFTRNLLDCKKVEEEYLR